MIQTQFIKTKNVLLNENIVTPRIVNMQSMDFDDWCDHLSDGSTLTAADVSAVMKQICKRLPTILGLNTKVVCSADGLTFRPKVSGSLSQSELKARLEAKKAAETDPEKAALIDVDRAITLSDLSVSDCTVSIEVDLPKSWNTIFQQKAKLKRVTKVQTDTDATDTGGSDDASTDETTSGTDSSQTSGTDSSQTSGGGSTTPSGDSGTGED